MLGISWLAEALPASQGLCSMELVCQLYYVAYTIDKLNVSTEHWWHGIDKGRVKNFEKTHCIAILSTTNPTWAALGSNLGLHGQKPASNCL